MKRFEESLREISFLNKNSERECKDILDKKMKPIGSLGVIEDIAERLSGILPYNLKNIKRKGCHIVAVADNGIVEEKISPCPEEYTRLVAEEMVNGFAPISLFCKNLGVDLKVIDVGMKKGLSKKYSNFYISKVVNGSKNFRKEPALTVNQVIDTIENGIFTIEELEEEYDVFSTGEMGIGNTTTSSAILYSLTRCSIDDAVGRGSGANDEILENKKKVIFESCIRYNTFQMNPIEILRHVGGLDIAFMVGLYIGAARYRKLILVDGFISVVAALLAIKLNPIIKNYILVTHLSEEPGMKLALKELGKEPFLNMKMRLGEGTGAVFAYPMIWGAVDIYENMKTPKEVYDLFF
ncbi:nicotinate-nucleotide--dimethylbenzimidazole phosphoribosyltransferase [Fusobacterium perfoetens]|uniref:nicotinate-nucleotide--dimethylbenzimidazole phosphoribosyltransferase n=1 Tax=Fusobacterium perfoetens TaxID=852 RepID=UPI0004895996|nr:nicotinate-nucleotide--dimethylbenzimidazole phosphoribosyltransferase [Fusobacterium perfoetens]MCI6153305.1 nicotinate-nucleotide--dimethylbenzimidazole phosphoribosyltransferase [Fusobacterium perfoetens]MDY3237823.1 nicotinate-nucleotide--dimethylbenzimidazole phosphoribosyltransferase [Fusobacterium perfoetens]